ncbi:chemotaxis protein CheW [Methanoregula sp.]|mgnify:CR=1 FL=1|uniref:chemotaxis protein CheW n=1 Tax=Methanoregula sp. TaxID=2052170 RepID=UPI002605E1B2|nr:chemotaxis protein CheW [Methanoregula sp.]MDD5144183.1 chemotaxis protein CheW [Methanoregula sp.]
MSVKASQPVTRGSTLPGQPNDSEPIQVVEFLLGSENFAINLFDVKEVVEYTTITKLPNVPSHVRGIIDLRGEITTIVDLKQRLNIREESARSIEASRIIVLDDKIAASKIGILVDDVTSVSTFEGNQVDYTSASVNAQDTAIIGIIKRKVKVKDKEKNELIIWIDLKQLLTDIDAAV